MIQPKHVTKVARYAPDGLVYAGSPLDTINEIRSDYGYGIGVLILPGPGAYWGVCVVCGARYYTISTPAGFREQKDIHTAEFCDSDECITLQHPITWKKNTEFRVVTSNEDRQEQYDQWLADLRNSSLGV